jgi:DNA polymerase-3 subunit alpha/error-prone DNA polymerase
MPVSLHTHSWYSLLEGASSLEALLDRAGACGYTSLALTDTNNLYGAVAFTDRAHRRGIRPLLGACLRQHRNRCVALVADPAGYRNLCRVISRLQLAAVNGPRPLAELLAENAAGLHVLVDDPVLAERLRDALGPRLWLEVVRPAAGSPGRERLLLEVGRRLGLRPVASAAAHFATPEEYPAFRLLTAVRRGGLLDQLPERLPVTPAHHLVPPDELRRRFHDLPEAVANTDLLAEQLRADVLPRDTVLPEPRLPRHVGAARYLRLLCERGLRRRDLGGDLGARRRLREELALIEAGCLADYFLVVREITRFARRRGYSMALRGSAGSSLVCYLLEITDINPLRFGLGLARFLHPGRPDLPDIDLDFDWRARDEVLAHVLRRRGPGHAALVSSHLFLQPRSAFREAAKAHGLSNEQVSELKIADVGFWASDFSVPLALPPNFPLEPARWPRLLRDARLLLGRPHHLSVHSGGVVLTPRPLEEYVPLQPAPKGVVITQFEKDAVEQIGLVKIDLLGNRALANVDEATRLATSTSSLLIPHPSSLITEDPAVLDLLRRGDTLGVTQMESPAMRHLLVQMRPRGIDDVIQALAVIRPGAAGAGVKECYLRRRRGLESVPRPHAVLDGLLDKTQGLMLYEDDALRVIGALTGLPVPDAYRFFKRVVKHQAEEEGRELAREFHGACTARDIGPGPAEELWRQLLKFRRYTFCKSHAVSYGLIAWTGAWLKVYHPLPFWTAVLNNNQGCYPRRVYVEAVKRAGLGLRLPCVNRSAEAFRPEGEAIRVGLGAVATLPEELRARLLAERGRAGPYRDLADLCRRVGQGPEALATLIRCGALDFTGQSRPALFLEAELWARSGLTGVGPLFPGPAGPGPTAGWAPADYPQERRWRDEWQLLGFLVGPPLLSLFRPTLPAGLCTSRDLAANLGKWVRVAGVVATARTSRSQDGRDMQFITLEDEGGLIEVTLFPGTCPLMAHLDVGPYLAAGVVDDHLGVLSVTARRFERCSV